MSMRDYGVDDYGLILSPDDIKTIAAKLYTDFSEDDWNADYYAYVEEIADELGIESISEFCGSDSALTDDGDFDWDSEYYSSEPIYYIGVSRYPTLFRQSYKNMEELIDEFKGKVGAYLPEDFGYRERIRHISGTYFG